MTDYYTGTDEARRAHALDEALRNLDIEATTDDVLARAGRFEAYLKGDLKIGEKVELTFSPTLDVDQRGAAEEPKVVTAELPLPKVSHSGVNNCLGCEWYILAKRAGHHTDEPLPKPPSHEMKQIDGALRCLGCDWSRLGQKIKKAEAGE